MFWRVGVEAALWGDGGIGGGWGWDGTSGRMCQTVSLSTDVEIEALKDLYFEPSGLEPPT